MATTPDWTFALATTNQHKAREIAEILAPLGIGIEVPESLPDVVEDGDTYAANARKKAASAAAFLGRPVLADDSGLEVPALGGAPGVRSARYAGADATADDNNQLLVESLERLGLKDPAAMFVCHATIVAPDGNVVVEAEGRVGGILRWPAQGREGFGYDPLFHHGPSDCRFSELSAEAKNATSHRGRALRALVRRLRKVEIPDPS